MVLSIFLALAYVRDSGFGGRHGYDPHCTLEKTEVQKIQLPMNG